LVSLSLGLLFKFINKLFISLLFNNQKTVFNTTESFLDERSYPLLSNSSISNFKFSFLINSFSIVFFNSIKFKLLFKIKFFILFKIFFISFIDDILRFSIKFSKKKFILKIDKSLKFKFFKVLNIISSVEK